MFASLSGSGSSGGNVGDYKISASANDEKKWFIANGRTLPAVDYPKLYEVIGSSYNVGGEPVGHFRLPNAQSRTFVGSGQGSGLSTRSIGQTGGEEAHSLTSAENGPHNHSGGVYNSGYENQYMDDNDGPSHTAETRTSTGSSGSGTPHNNMQPYIVGCIKIKVK